MSPEPERPPGWVVWMVAALLGLGLLGGWLLWRDLELTLGSGAVVLAILVGLAWSAWGWD